MAASKIAEMRAYAIGRLADVPDGEGLLPLDKALIALAVASSVTCLDEAGLEKAISNAFAADATSDQVQEIVTLASGLGVHSLMAAENAILRSAKARGLIDDKRPYDEAQQALWDRHVAGDPYWTGFSEEFPGFLDAMLRLSPDTFVAFFAYCAIPWKHGHVRARVKELAALACDVSPSHCFGPGFRLHLANAIGLGIGRTAIIEAMDIAAASPPHSGYRVSP